MADDKELKSSQNMPEAEPGSELEDTSIESGSDELSGLQHLKNWYMDRKKWTIPASLLLFIIILAAVPFTRYGLAGIVLKKNFTVQVFDSETNTPVSGAAVSLGSKTTQTNSVGKAVLPNVNVGNHMVTITKKYYADGHASVVTPIFKGKNLPTVKLQATGRQAQITVKDLVSLAALANVNVKVAGTSAKTDNKGQATVVLPTGSATQKATLGLSGYNDDSVTIKVSDTKIENNEFSLTPAGKIYFLSKLSGKIDVVKTNLDGGGRQTVLAGTGNEDDHATVLLAARDWKYLALLARRAGSSATLYLIDTSDDSLSVIDEGSADFNLAGWAGYNFIYTVTRNNVQLWQPGRQALKSYSAPNKKITLLDQTTASGTGQFDYITSLIGEVYAYGDQVLYIDNWTSAYNAPAGSLASKQATLSLIKPDGASKRTIRSFGLAPGAQALDVTLEDRIETPNQVDLKFSDGTKDNFYIYASGQVKDDPGKTLDNFYTEVYPTYLQSPAGTQTFWSESRDGKNTLFIGDQNGENGKQIAALSDYFTYGWYSDNYLLVSKNSSELYITSRATIKNPVKISDYHKPLQSFNGYGGGYGGI